MKSAFKNLIFHLFLLTALGEKIYALEVDTTSSNLPIIFINTNGQTIVDQARIIADMGIVYNGPGQRNHLEDPWNHYNGKIAIELRGSSSQFFPQKPYGFETQDMSGNNLNVSLLGMPAENDWVLHNPYSDKSLIRNVLAYKISNDIGRYASRSSLCEVILNGDYQGVYVLLEKLKRDNERVDIATLDEDDVAGDSLTGGYIIKIDKQDGEQLGGWVSTSRIFYQYHYPKPSDIKPQQKTYIKDFMSMFESVLTGPDYADPNSGYTKYFDLDAAVDQFIINEISKNVDAYRLSFFMYKDRDDKNGKLYLGPAWDFNLSFGNANYYQGWLAENWNFEHLYEATNRQRDYPPPYWLELIWQDMTFRTKFVQRWHQLRQDELNTDSLLTYIDVLADSLDEAQLRNDMRWQVLGVWKWPNWFVGNTYAEEIDFMKTWLTERIDWIDANIDNLLKPTSVALNGKKADLPSTFSLGQNYPNPFNPTTTINYTLPKDSFVELKIYNLLGKEIQTLVAKKQAAGFYRVVFNGSDLGSGLYFYRLEADGFKDTKRLVLVK